MTLSPARSAMPSLLFKVSRRAARRYCGTCV
jgi:hypothetical protein